MAGNCWKYLKIAENILKCLEIVGSAKNAWKWMEMDGIV